MLLTSETARSHLHLYITWILSTILVKVGAVFVNGPLTTTFTPSSTCFYTTAFDADLPSSTGGPISASRTNSIIFGLAIADTAIGIGTLPARTDCYPSDYGSGGEGGYFSPGLACPVGYTTGPVSTISEYMYAVCCPTGYDQTGEVHSCLKRIFNEETLHVSALIAFPTNTPTPTGYILTSLHTSYTNEYYFDITATGIGLMWHSSDLIASNTAASSYLSTSQVVATSPTSSAANGGLSRGAKIGLGVGIPLAVLSILGCGITCLFVRRRRRKQKDKHPHDKFNELHGTTALHELHDKPAQYELHNTRALHELHEVTVMHELETIPAKIELDAQGSNMTEIETPKSDHLPELTEPPAPPIQNDPVVAYELASPPGPHIQLAEAPRPDSVPFESNLVAGQGRSEVSQESSPTIPEEPSPQSSDSSTPLAEYRQEDEELAWLDAEEERIRSRMQALQSHQR